MSMASTTLLWMGCAVLLAHVGVAAGLEEGDDEGVACPLLLVTKCGVEDEPVDTCSQCARCEEGPEYRVVDSTADVLRSWDAYGKPLVVDAVVGPMRSGKSTLHNLKARMAAHARCLDTASSPEECGELAAPASASPEGKSPEKEREDGASPVFPMGMTAESCTRGIWMWPEPIHLADGRLLVLLDVEGTGGGEDGDDYHLGILSVLAASELTILSASGSLMQNEVEFLATCGDFAHGLVSGARGGLGSSETCAEEGVPGARTCSTVAEASALSVQLQLPNLRAVFTNKKAKQVSADLADVLGRLPAHCDDDGTAEEEEEEEEEEDAHVGDGGSDDGGEEGVCGLSAALAETAALDGGPGRADRVAEALRSPAVQAAVRQHYVERVLQPHDRDSADLATRRELARTHFASRRATVVLQPADDDMELLEQARLAPADTSPFAATMRHLLSDWHAHLPTKTTSLGGGRTENATASSILAVLRANVTGLERTRSVALSLQKAASEVALGKFQTGVAGALADWYGQACPSLQRNSLALLPAGTVKQAPDFSFPDVTLPDLDPCAKDDNWDCSVYDTYRGGKWKQGSRRYISRCSYTGPSVCTPNRCAQMAQREGHFDSGAHRGCESCSIRHSTSLLKAVTAGMRADHLQTVRDIEVRHVRDEKKAEKAHQANVTRIKEDNAKLVLGWIEDEADTCKADLLTQVEQSVLPAMGKAVADTQHLLPAVQSETLESAQRMVNLLTNEVESQIELDKFKTHLMASKDVVKLSEERVLLATDKIGDVRRQLSITQASMAALKGHVKGDPSLAQGVSHQLAARVAPPEGHGEGDEQGDQQQPVASVSDGDGEGDQQQPVLRDTLATKKLQQLRELKEAQQALEAQGFVFSTKCE